MKDVFWTYASPDRSGIDSNDWARLAGDVADLGYWRLDVASGTASCSEGLLRLYGLQRGDLPDLSAAVACLHPEDIQRTSELLRRAIDFGEGFDAMLRLRRADGTWRVFRSRCECRRDLAGKVVTVFGAMQDVSASENYRVLAENGNDLIVQTDLAGKITYVSPSVEALAGRAATDIVGAAFSDFVNPADMARVDAAIQAALTNPGRCSPGVEFRVEHADGRVLWLESRPTALMIAGSGGAVGTTGVVRDITERKKAEDELAFSNAVLRTTMEAAPCGMALVNAQREVVSANQTFLDIWKIPSADISNYRAIYEALIAAVSNPDEYERRVQYLYDHPTEEGLDEIETRDGRSIERYSVTLPSASGDFIGRAWFYRDISDRKNELAHALSMSRFDELTGLANRGGFVHAIDQAIAAAKRNSTAFAVLYLDLDHFKDVNDTLGHGKGDELLKAVASRLRSNTRQTDTVARFGGDEFALITGSSCATEVAAVAEKLVRVLGEPYFVAGDWIHTGASIGIDIFNADAHDTETLLSHADLALYRAKAEGRGAYRFFTPAMDTEVRTRVTLAKELHDALAGEQLFLVYQPQIHLESGRLMGVEALCRWRHPVRGLVSPDVFIPVAEQMGLINKLGQWVLRESCRQAAAWRAASLSSGRMCVNLSALQFKRPLDLESDIATALSETGLPPDLLELELTETVLMHATREHGDVLLRLRERGIAVAIDDFGTGYSSLDYLRRFPADRIKIAQTFVKNVETLPGNAAIVKATIGLGRELGIPVIAEGVETREQLDLLRASGCSEVQGYYFSHPLVASALTELLRGGGLFPCSQRSLLEKAA